ncbi:ABC transporter permease [Brytella acorum]|uniref:ABC transporter permease n=1 Tax=Brytella acorum TaxID=2959299 RepID=A0AA35Y3T2_9PROT|nr:ABC transporter permease [Brytella acorum]MDF3623391.1 ABC transporter permease [Brytella acorum]CAI9120498.1 ABC transporter permease [Brytella acorum]
MKIPRLNWRHVLLVASRDFRQTLRTRSFWLTVFLMPMLPVVGGLAGSRLAGDSEREKIVVIDPDGHMEPRLAAALHRVAPDIDVTPAPEALTKLQTEALDDAFRSYIAPPREDPHPPKGYVIAVPRNFPNDVHVRIWVSHNPGHTIITTINDVMSTGMRDAAMTQAGLSPAEAARINALEPTLSTRMPKHGLSDATLAKIAPTALAYILMLAVIMSAQWLLQAMVEERSGKLLEALLACITPDELLCGKLIATLEALVVLFAAWIGAGLLAAAILCPHLGLSFTQIVAPLTSLRMLIGAPFFLLTGSAALALICLAIGAQCETLREAQGMMMPVIFVLMLPVQMLLQMQVAGTATQAVAFARWVPIWTPFLDLPALSTQADWSIFAQGGLLLGFCILEAVVLTRVFRHALLRNDTGSKWGSLVAALLGQKDRAL